MVELTPSNLIFRQEVKSLTHCTICRSELPLEPKPIFQLHSDAKILIIGQAPGLKTHQKNRPFDDPSGERLRTWLQLNESQFYDPKLVAIMPMAFCYPGKVASGSGDKPPPAICHRTWHDKFLHRLQKVQIVILLGSHAAKAYYPEFKDLTDAISTVKEFSVANTAKVRTANTFVLPHPSPRNNIWLSKNRWFETKTLPILRQRLTEILN